MLEKQLEDATGDRESTAGRLRVRRTNYPRFCGTDTKAHIIHPVSWEGVSPHKPPDARTQEAEGEVRRLRERLAYVQQPYHYLVEKLQARAREPHGRRRCLWGVVLSFHRERPSQAAGRSWRKHGAGVSHCAVLLVVSEPVPADAFPASQVAEDNAEAATQRAGQLTGEIAALQEALLTARAEREVTVLAPPRDTPCRGARVLICVARVLVCSAAVDSLSWPCLTRSPPPCPVFNRRSARTCRGFSPSGAPWPMSNSFWYAAAFALPACGSSLSAAIFALLIVWL